MLIVGKSASDVGLYTERNVDVKWQPGTSEIDNILEDIEFIASIKVKTLEETRKPTPPIACSSAEEYMKYHEPSFWMQ